MNLLFWNLNGNPVGAYVKDCLLENAVDIAVFAEHGEVNLPALAAETGGLYPYAEEREFAGKIAVMAAQSVQIVRKWDIDTTTRLALFHLYCDGRPFILGGIHLQDRWSGETAVRITTIRNILSYVAEMEKTVLCDHTIIIGDLNANPYDPELLQMDAFNAVLFKDVIRRSASRTVDGVAYRSFYNPILHFLSEDTKNYGSYYHKKGACTPVWHCLDQVLVSAALADSVADLRYLRTIGNNSLIRDVRPDKTISDHLPLFVTIDLKEV